MDHKEHIATLCALGTLGAAVAGLTFGIDHKEAAPLPSGKRKWPGTSSTVRPIRETHRPEPSRRSISQPTPGSLIHDAPVRSNHITPSTFTNLPGRLFAGLQEEDNTVKSASSRGSSASRQSLFRPRTANSRPHTEHRNSGTSSNWLKRLSSLSSHSNSPAASLRFFERDTSTVSSLTDSRPATSDHAVPNKLVKRSTSQRMVSQEHARGHIFRRPTTSHQRSEILAPFLHPAGKDTTRNQENRSTLRQDSIPIPSNLRHYLQFVVPRKRRKSEVVAEAGQLRIVSLPAIRDPWLALGHDIDQSDRSEDARGGLYYTQQPSSAIQTRKSPRPTSLLPKPTRRRNFTDPSVHLNKTAVNGIIMRPTTVQSMSPVSKTSAFEIILPHDTPVFGSSPEFSRDNHVQVAPSGIRTPSEHTTNKSDIDMQVFTDDDSELRADSAYDSIVTGNHCASHDETGISDLDTSFTTDASNTGIDKHMLNGRFVECERAQDKELDIQEAARIDITALEQKLEGTPQFRTHISTPPRAPSIDMDDLQVTPVPPRTTIQYANGSPSPHPLTFNVDNVSRSIDLEAILQRMDLDEDDINWSPESSGSVQLQHGSTAVRIQDESADATDRRHLAFDFSENNNVAHAMSRPRTMHSKQGENPRNRTNSRRRDPQLHFRSHSVPVTRDISGEALSLPSKFSTWKVAGTKKVEEWGDDFDFDDELSKPILDVPLPGASKQADVQGPSQSVKIPQTIIDKQPSVRLQFGQIQEFMLLVEELKRLRLAGAKLHLLDGHARNLWEDAESIINLATINDEEEELKPPTIVVVGGVDPFTEPTPPPPPTVTMVTTPTNRPRRGTIRRSVSQMATPLPTGRARGESLAQTQHFLQTMHTDRDGWDASPREIEIHREKKTPFDTQDLRDLVVKSGVITRALKEEIRRADPISVSPQRTPTRVTTLETMFRAPEDDGSPASPSRTGLTESRSAHGFLEQLALRNSRTASNTPISRADEEMW